MAERPDTLARKTVTVLFCDVVGSTNLGDRVDPETTRGVMLRYFDETRAVLEHHGGTVEKFIGDAVMAVFGVPVVHEDDALRAVRAADDMRAKLDRLNDELERRWGVRLEWRIGINTGEVVVGDPTSTQTIGSGDTFNVAARLQQAAQPGQILLGRETHALVRDRISAGPLEAFSLKGKRERIAPWQLERVHERTSGLLRRLDAPFVGREPEREFLERAYRASVDEASCRLVTVVGPAGIGKSRLAQEFAARLLAAEVLHGRCLPYGEGITFWPVTEIVQDAAGIVGSDSPTTARAKIAKLVEATDDAELVCERVSSTIGLSESETRTEEAFWALRRFVEAVARQRPLVLIFEDIHWAEPTLLDLIEYLVGWSGGTAILVVCLARPELIDVRPAWPGDTIVIEPLPASEIEALAASAVGSGPLDPAVSARIVAAADGNPLFAEEFARMLVDEGLLAKLDGIWAATGDVDDVAMPPTINALLSARLDRLDADEREVLQAASVVGREFWSGSIRALAPHVADGVAQHLHALVRKRLIMPGGSSPIAGEDAFRFTHILVRDAAYGTLAKMHRAEMHERHADWLLEKSGERATELGEIVGYHLEQSYRAREEIGPTGPHARAVAERGSEFLAAAGRRALDRGDTHAGAALLQRAFVLLEEDRALVELAPDVGTALSDAGQLEEAEALFERAIEAAEETGDERARAHAAVGLAHVRVRTSLAGAEHDLRAAATDGIETFTRLDDRRGLANALRLLSLTWAWDCQLDAMAEALRRALAEAEAAGDHRQRLTTLQMLAAALYYGPTDTDSAIRHCEDVLAAAAGHGGVEASVSCYLSGLLAMAGRFDEAREYSLRGTKLLDELGPSVAGHARAALADAEVLAGDPRAAEQELKTAYDATTRIGDRSGAFSFVYDLAAVLCAQGRYDEAEQWATRGRSTVERSDAMTRVIALTTDARLEAHRGRMDEARALAERAVELGERTDALNLRAAAWLALADVALLDGRDADAQAAVDRALALYAEKGNAAAAAQVAEADSRASVASSALRRGNGGT